MSTTNDYAFLRYLADKHSANNLDKLNFDRVCFFGSSSPGVIKKSRDAFCHGTKAIYQFLGDLLREAPSEYNARMGRRHYENHPPIRGLR